MLGSGTSGFRCKCGFSAARDVGLQRHLELNKGTAHCRAASTSSSSGVKADLGSETGSKSWLTSLPPSKADNRGQQATESTAAAVAEPERSLLSRLSLNSLWPSAAGVGPEPPLEVSSPTEPTLRMVDSAPQELDSDPDDPDSAWEAVSEVAGVNSSMDYAQITSLLATPKQQAHKRDVPGDSSKDTPARARGSAALGQARKLLSWGHTSLMGDPAANLAACHKASAALAGSGPKLSVSADDVQDILLWRDGWRSAKVFGIGLYSLICLRALVMGNELLQPTTALATAALLVLIYNAVHQLWTQQLQQDSKQASTQRELQLQQQVANRFIAVALMAAPCISALATLLVRSLSGQDGLGARVWLGLALWMAACVSEAQLCSQPTMLMVFWLAAFALPAVYGMCKAALDGLVDEAVHFVSSLLYTGQRTTLYVAGGAGLCTFCIMGGGVVLRLSTSATAVGSFLFWKFYQQRLRGEELAQG